MGEKSAIPTLCADDKPGFHNFGKDEHCFSRLGQMSGGGSG